MLVLQKRVEDCTNLTAFKNDIDKLNADAGCYSVAIQKKIKSKICIIVQ